MSYSSGYNISFRIATSAGSTPAGSPFGENGVAVLFVMGQSNAAGVNGISPTSADCPNIYKMSATARTWSSWDLDWNNYSTAADNMNPAGAFALQWQSRIDDGEDLPDLYILTVAYSGQGVSTSLSGSAATNRWNPISPFYMNTAAGGPHASNKWTDGDTGGATGRSLYDVARKAVAAGMTELSSSGKSPRILGLVWVQGEKDSSQDVAAAEYEGLVDGIFVAVREAAGVESLPIFPYALNIPNTTTYAYQYEINSAFHKIAKRNAWSYVTVPESSSLWNPTVGNRGIFGSDALHYATPYLSESALRLYERTVGSGFYGVPVVTSSVETDWTLYTGSV